jgi:hypothetical protein
LRHIDVEQLLEEHCARRLGRSLDESLRRREQSHHRIEIVTRLVGHDAGTERLLPPRFGQPAELPDLPQHLLDARLGSDQRTRLREHLGEHTRPAPDPAVEPGQHERPLEGIHQKLACRALAADRELELAQRTLQTAQQNRV